MSELLDRLNALAERGTPRGFDAVLDAATKSASLEAVEGGESASGDLDPIPFVTLEPSTRHRRRPFASMIAAAGVASLFVVASLSVSALFGHGGASSPEAAVRELADAVSHEDPLAAADVVSPDEVRSLHGTLDEAAKKAAELSLVQNASAPLTGVDLNVDNLKLSTETLADGFAKVTIDTGVLSASTQKARFSALMQKVLRDSEDNSAQTDLATLASNIHMPTFVVAIRHEGSWYVSAAYTALEYFREYNKLPAADFGSGVRSASTLGAESPDAAVQNGMRALGQGDFSKLLTLAPPDEIPVYDYRNAINAYIQQNSDPQSSSTQSLFTISSMTTTSQVNGDTAQVVLHAAGTSDAGRWSLDGGCFTPPDSQAVSTCVASDTRATYAYGYGALSLYGTLSGGVDQPTTTIATVKQDGRWFVSPVGTVLDVLNRAIAGLDRRSLYTTLGIPNQLPPDGTLVLGQPVTFTSKDSDLRILRFDGHKGEHLLGQAVSSGTAKRIMYELPANVQIFQPDGRQWNEGLFYGDPGVTLPVDGVYTFVVYRVTDADATVTIWDADKAPAKAHTDPSFPGCSITTAPIPIGGSSSKSPSSSSSVSSTIPFSGGVASATSLPVSPDSIPSIAVPPVQGCVTASSPLP